MKQSRKTDRLCAEKILRHIGDLKNCLTHFEIKSHRDFENKRLSQFAATQIITIIHELKIKITAETLCKLPEFNKIKIAGARNIASHDYEKINFRMIFDICKMLTSEDIENELNGVIKYVGDNG
jgi:uncharacterized protein with HEPN domain